METIEQVKTRAFDLLQAMGGNGEVRITQTPEVNGYFVSVSAWVPQSREAEKQQRRMS